MDANPVVSALNIHPMMSAVQASPLAIHDVQAATPRTLNTNTFGGNRQMAWHVERGAGEAPESINQFNGGSQRKFETQFQPR